MHSRVERFLPYGRQNIDQEDIEAVIKVFDGDYITQGPKIREFEEAVAVYVGARYAVACNSGTSALHLACQALGLGDSGKLVTSPITFLASANCAQFVGADSMFVDIDSETYCMSSQELEKLLQKENVDVVVPVHMAGHSADMEAIFELKKKYGFHIIEDACHALGGKYKGIKVGSCAFSEMSIFSFHPVKHITTAEGGAVTTNDKNIYEKLLRFRNHGMHKDSGDFINRELAFDNDEDESPNLWYYEMPEVGHNYRITDIQCALGLSQLRKNDKFIENRREIARKYNGNFRESQLITIPFESEDSTHAYHLYTILVDFDKLGKSRNKVMKELLEFKIGTQVLYIPVHLQPYYAKKYGYRLGDFPVSEDYYNHCLSIPIFPSLTNAEVDYVIETVNAVISY
jgi:UDP-4-amino-4,6-dideoxy-N-acetyl-beta-L-altrosamine transaminase